MSKIRLHCLDPKERPTVIAHATSKKLQHVLPREHNPHLVEISGAKNTVENFAKFYETKGNVAVFYDHDHPKSGKDKLKPRLCKSKTRKPIPKSEITPNTNYGNTVTVMATRYNFPIQNCSPPVIAVISLGGNFIPGDLVHYWQTILALPSWANVLNYSVDGASYGFSGSDADLENTLDLEITGGICPTATIILISAPNTDQGFYDGINQAISGMTINDKFYQPTVISISWGAPESSYSNTTMAAFDQLFNVGRSHGITTSIAAGDNGATDGVSGGLPHLDFPSSSPHAVACGGTTISGETETAWSWNPTHDWGTGGGISAYFAEPSWQVPTVVYPTGNTPSTAYLNGNRASPDIAMNADPDNGWTIYFNGELYTNSVGGTSCVAPAMSGLIALMGLSYLNGFNNNMYTVYQNVSDRSTCFNDITSGTNGNIPSSSGVYNAGVGYDCCTGLGTPNGVNLYNVLKTMS
jgi:kumamolisin